MINNLTKTKAMAGAAHEHVIHNDNVQANIAITTQY
jgi:hypothetical protein